MSQVKEPVAASSYKLAKVVGVLAITASALSQEYGSGINFVATQSLSVYPRVEWLVPLAMFVTGLFYLPKVYLFMRFGRVMPRAGGSYTWITRSLGMRIGFIVHFLWWASLAFAIGVLAYAFGTFLETGLVSAGLQGAAALGTPWGHVAVGTAAIWLVFWLHFRGISNYAALVQLAMVLVVIAAAVVIAVGFGNPPAAFVTAVQARLHVSLSPPAAAPAPDLASFVSVCTLFIFAYGGISAAPFLGGEAKDRERTVPSGIFWGWATALILFTLVAAAVFHAAPWWAIIQLIHAGKSSYTTTPGLVGLLASPVVASGLNLLVALIVGKTIAPQMLGTSRLVFAWAEDHLLPDVFSRTSRYKTPHAALLVSAGVGTLSLLQSALVGWSIGVTFRSIAILLVLALLGVGVLNLRWGRRFARAPWREAVAQGPLVVVAAVLAIVIPLVLIASVLVVPKAPLVFQPAFQALVAVLLGVWLYGWGERRAKRRGISVTLIEEQLPLE